MPLITVAGLAFECPTIYAPGHLCTEAEAAELDRLRLKRITERARRMHAEGKTRGEIESFIANFRFSCAPLPRDPIEEEALRIAKELANFRGLDDAGVAALAQTDSVRAEAVRRIAATQRAAERMMEESLGL